MRNYELMVILDPNLDERTITPSLETFLRVIRNDGGTVEKVDIWGKRRMAYEIAKHAEGIYAVLDVVCEAATVAELDRQLGLNESVLRTKVMRVEAQKRKSAARAAAPGGPAAVAAASTPADAPPASTPAADAPAASTPAAETPAASAPAESTPAAPAEPPATPAD
jgi:small subunit ribosomal protein S6